MRENRTILPLALLLATSASLAPGPAACADGLIDELKQVPHKIVYETYRDTSWELFLVNADGPSPVNLTRTGDVDELYPHASPDGSRICFVADEGEGFDPRDLPDPTIDENLEKLREQQTHLGKLRKQLDALEKENRKLEERLKKIEDAQAK